MNKVFKLSEALMLIYQSSYYQRIQSVTLYFMGSY